MINWIFDNQQEKITLPFSTYIEFKKNHINNANFSERLPFSLNY